MRKLDICELCGQQTTSNNALVNRMYTEGSVEVHIDDISDLVLHCVCKGLKITIFPVCCDTAEIKIAC